MDKWVDDGMFRVMQGYLVYGSIASRSVSREIANRKGRIIAGYRQCRL
jgi:hypothetical protein